MTLLGRLRARLSTAGGDERPRAALAEAEQLMRAGAAVLEIRRTAAAPTSGNDVERAWRALFSGDLEAALASSRRAAEARPYDVDSRIVHGTVRLASNELEHAEHEFDAVIEEFGAESDAANGRRATILARGYAPVDELPASDQEWLSAAVLLTTLWRLTGVADERIQGLHAGHPEGLELILRALSAGRTADEEVGDGAL